MTPDEKTPIEDNTYDLLMCSAGMFPGSIVPQAFKELLRIVKPGGILAWNIADGYEGFNDFFLSYDKIMTEHVEKGDWEYVMPAKKEEKMLFEDAGYTYVMKKLKWIRNRLYSACFMFTVEPWTLKLGLVVRCYLVRKFLALYVDCISRLPAIMLTKKFLSFFFSF